jgi:hypothetical protein
MTVMEIILGALGVLCTAFLGSFLGGYMKKRGENLATKEDLQNVLVQVSAVTSATEEIKAQIAGGLWDRQKRWEIKKEVLFEAGRKLVGIEKSLMGMSSAFIAAAKYPNLGFTKEQRLACRKVTEAQKEFDEAKFLARLVCSNSTSDALDNYYIVATGIAKAMSGGQTTAWKDNLDSFIKSTVAVRLALQLELSAAPKPEV